MNTISQLPVALVTGAGQGLGKVMAEVFQQAGYNVVLCGRTASKLKSVNDLNGGTMLEVPTDLTQPDQVRELFRRIDDVWGRIDVVINNAGFYPPVLLEDATDAHIMESIGCNLLAPIYCMREAIPRMREAGGGDIVNITSESVRITPPYHGLYAGGKAAVEVVGNSVRHELRGSNIRIVNLRSGHIESSDNLPDFNDPHFQQFWKKFSETGFASMMAVGSIPPKALAEAALHAIRSPREATLELIELRPAPNNYTLPI